MMLWLWRRPPATAPIQPSAWELPYATHEALIGKKKRKKKPSPFYFSSDSGGMGGELDIRWWKLLPTPLLFSGRKGVWEGGRDWEGRKGPDAATVPTDSRPSKTSLPRGSRKKNISFCLSSHCLEGMKHYEPVLQSGKMRARQREIKAQPRLLEEEGWSQDEETTAQAPPRMPGACIQPTSLRPEAVAPLALASSNMACRAGMS